MRGPGNISAFRASRFPPSKSTRPARTASRAGVNSILAASLKKGTLYRLPLSDEGRSISGDAIPLFRTTNRYRDVAIAPDKQTIYIATDKGDAAGPDNCWTEVLGNPGAILEFKYDAAAPSMQ